MLRRRLVEENRATLAQGFSFLSRMLAQRRRDHGLLLAELLSVLRADGGTALQAELPHFELQARRDGFDVLWPLMSAEDSPILQAALRDPDVVIRVRAVHRLAELARDSIIGWQSLQRVFDANVAGAVRRAALVKLLDTPLGPGVAERALLDHTSTVRQLAQDAVRRLALPIRVNDVYVEAVQSKVARRVAAALEGLSETSAALPPDAFDTLLTHQSPRVRSASLRLLASTDWKHSLPRLIAALGDPSSFVRRRVRRILAAQRSRVDFANVWRVVKSLDDPRARRDALGLIDEASKWDALEYFLEALHDSDGAVRDRAVKKLARWTERFNRSFPQPRREQLAHARALLEQHRGVVPSPYAEFLAFTLGTHSDSRLSTRTDDS